MTKILVVEDEPGIAFSLEIDLKTEGYEVEVADKGGAGLDRIRAMRPDLVILDLMMPTMDGLEVCRRLRQDPATASLPIVMLTAKGDEVDRVLGLEIGADDYVVKPFSPKELVARVRAVLRRSRSAPGAAPLRLGALVMDLGTHTASVGGEVLALTPKEFDLLRALVEARGRVLSREFLLDRVWGYSRASEIESRTVDVHVRRLRVKLGPEGRRILTVKSVGYRLDTAA